MVSACAEAASASSNPSEEASSDRGLLTEDKEKTDMKRSGPADDRLC